MSNKYGKILSYRPNITYHKKNHNKNLSNNYIYDSVIEDYINNTPYNNIKKSNNILEKAEKTLLQLQNQFFETRYMNNTFLQYSDMVDNNHDERVDEIYSEAFKDIESDIVIEIYKDVHNEYCSLVDFDKTYKRSNYQNEGINVDESFDIDTDNANKIYKYQFSEDEKINYAALNYESKLNKIVEMKLEISDIYLGTLGATPLDNEVDKVSSSKDKVKEGTNVLFESINEEYYTSKIEFNSAHDFSKFSKLYNYICNLLIDFYELLSIKESLFDNSGNSFCIDIENAISKKGEEIDFHIIELYKLVAIDSMLIDKFFNLLNKKDQIKKFYKNID